VWSLVARADEKADSTGKRAVASPYAHDYYLFREDAKQLFGVSQLQQSYRVGPTMVTSKGLGWTVWEKWEDCACQLGWP
jgi:hypothetical protein